MARIIGRKLDFLMTLTGTKNNMLAKALSFDTSHISRIRSGQRGLPTHRDFLEPASQYFARHIKEPYQVSGAEDAICPGRSFPKNIQQRANLIASWMLSEDTGSQDLDDDRPAEEESKALGRNYYLGNEGKRQAAQRLLQAALDDPDSSRLLLYSDEDMSWMTEDPAFFRQWAGMMMSILTGDNRITIIHNLSRNLDELMTAVSGWIPLYFTGNIAPWYCPRLRDEVFHMTRFILAGKEAVVGGYAGTDYERAYSIYVQERGMVKVLEDQFAALLKLCRPLMAVYSEKNGDDPCGAIEGFRKKTGKTTSRIQRPQDIHYYVKGEEALILSPAQRDTVLYVKDPMLLGAVKEFVMLSPENDTSEDLFGLWEKER